MVKRFLAPVLLTGLAFAQVSTPPAPPFAPELTIPAIFAPGGVTGAAPETVAWSPDGNKVSYILREGDAERAQLWVVDAANGKKSVLVASQKMASLAPPPANVSEREAERRSRYSVAEYQWAPDSRHLLFDSLGQLWLYDLATGTAVQITSSSTAVLDPRFSPDGKYISYVQKHNLWVRKLDGGATQLTRDTDENILNGEADWVYAEELDVRRNYAWSPDSRHLLFLQMDETHVPTYPLTELIPLTPAVDMQKYPKPGDPNPTVRLGVINVGGGRVQWLKVPAPSPTQLGPGAQDFYVPRFGWLRDGIAWVQVLNRAQDQLDVYFVETGSGRSRLVLTEKGPDWVEVNDNFTPLPSGRFLWTSWRDGHTHIYLFSFDGANPLESEARLERQLTRGDFEVFTIDAVDEELVYFTTNAGDPRQRQLFRVRLDGTGSMEQVSREPGTHQASFGGRGRRYVDNFSALLTPPRLSLCDNGACRAFWESRSVEAYKLIEPRWVDFKAEDGTVLYGLLLLPQATGKVPLLLNPYGGPGVQSVRNLWGGGTTAASAYQFLFHQLLAREGIAVLTVDNHGMAGRGRAFTAVLKHNFGGVEIKDQLAAVQQAVAAYPQLDSTRVGFWGWSYGGTMTLWALTRTPAFRAGVSVAPVANWRDYDSIYTERYMGLPQQNAEAYTRSSPLSTAGGLQGSLLLMHGTGDDNVHMQHTMQMMEAFIEAGKRFELMLYPRQTHSVAGAAARIDLFTRMQQHFEKELLGRPQAARSEVHP